MTDLTPSELIESFGSLAGGANFTCQYNYNGKPLTVIDAKNYVTTFTHFRASCCH
ncbi:MAG: hypothetical protein NTNFB01_07810 [Nitrospira sp.]|jgi:hypothetical protein